jgi:hypothetical protein
MNRLVPAIALCLVLAPQTGHALQLRWGSGVTDLTFTEAIRCTLVVRADSAEVALPAEARLLWVADGSSIQFVALDSLVACGSDTAQVSGIDGPKTLADSSANLITAHFCSAGANGPPAADYIVDLPGGAHGKLKVVAVDPADSNRVIESNEVTFNGGVDGGYPAAILHTSTVHRSTDFQLEAVGIGLDSTRALALEALDGSWHQPLRIVSKSGAAVLATASLAAQVPACVAEAQIGGTILTAVVPADPSPPPLDLGESGGCVRRFEEILDPEDPYMIQPGDFAFLTGAWTPSGTWGFHLLYIRSNQRLSWENTSKNLGHAVSTNLLDWTVVDTAAVRTRGGRFDSLHVWAPSIVLKGLTYYMFYTGVDADSNQRIGLATSTDLVTWVQGDSVLEVGGGDGVGHVFWADSAPGGGNLGKQQLRDPFVMRDPERPGGWLMYFATVSKQYSPQGVIGVARSRGDSLESWGETFPLWNTAYPFPSSEQPFGAESPQAFYRNGNWWLLWTIPSPDYRNWAESSRYGPIDTVTVDGNWRWTAAQQLMTLVPPMQSQWFSNWHASEYLRVSDQAEYLGGICDKPVGIQYTKMLAVSDTTLLFEMSCDSMLADVGETRGTPGAPDLSLAGSSPAQSRVRMRVDLPGRMQVHVGVYDIAGRRVRTILDGELPAGETQLVWDARNGSGMVVGSGVYFARLTTAGGRKTVRVLLIK